VVLRGRLELHGVTRDLELNVVPRADPEGNAYVARGRLDRQAFGLHWNQDLDIGGFVVGDEVELAVEVKLVRAEDDVKGNA
jgi:polyisoprenoid-binding protein YceI